MAQQNDMDRKQSGQKQADQQTGQNKDNPQAGQNKSQNEGKNPQKK